MIVSSSGSQALDKKSCELSIAKATFSPALDAAGNAIESTYTLPNIRWKLDPLDPVEIGAASKLLSSSNIEVAVDEHGTVVSCRATPAGEGDVVGCSTMPIGRSLIGQPTFKGKPTRALITITRQVRIQAK